MTRLSYEAAEALVFDPISANRSATRSALNALGFRRVESVSSIDGFVRSIRVRSPDLALCEVQSDDAKICNMIQALRQDTAGVNPFIVIIAITWDKSSAMVNRVLNAGADDLLLRPFSMGVLAGRIEVHAERRKGFVITHDYVGPDRRRDPNRSQDMKLFEPPNSLKIKAMGGLNIERATARLETELQTARDFLNAEKMRRDTYQICILWRLVQESTPEQESYGRDLAKIATLTKGVSMRGSAAGLGAAGRLCESVLAAVEGLEQGIDRNVSMHLLGQSVMNLNQMAAPGKTADEHLSAINATIATIRERNKKAWVKGEGLTAKGEWLTANSEWRTANGK